LLHVMVTPLLVTSRRSAATFATVNPPRQTSASCNCGLGSRRGDPLEKMASPYFANVYLLQSKTGNRKS